MSNQIGLLLKMLLPSVAISIAIKYLSNSLAPVPTTLNVTIAVFLPSVVLAIALGIRGWWRSAGAKSNVSSG
jgi:predicted membrane chloride channel (bestrophin family)